MNDDTQKQPRWVEKLDSFQKAFTKLKTALESENISEFSELEKEGVIQRFEYTYEMAFKAVKSFYRSVGDTNIKGSIDAFQKAFQDGLVKSETHSQALMRTVADKNQTGHLYHEETAERIFYAIKEEYAEAFEALLNGLLAEKQQRL